MYLINVLFCIVCNMFYMVITYTLYLLEEMTHICKDTETHKVVPFYFICVSICCRGTFTNFTLLLIYIGKVKNVYDYAE